MRPPPRILIALAMRTSSAISLLRTLLSGSRSLTGMSRTTIADLPFELLERILVLAVDEYLPDSPKALSSRNAFLRDVALVSRQFRCPGQAVLWSVVRVHAAGTAKRLLSSPVLGMYGTRFLDLAGVHSGVEGLSGSVAARVLAKLRGIQILRIADFGRLSARVLQSESLSGKQPLLSS